VREGNISVGGEERSSLYLRACGAAPPSHAPNNNKMTRLAIPNVDSFGGCESEMPTSSNVFEEYYLRGLSGNSEFDH